MLLHRLSLIWLALSLCALPAAFGFQGKKKTEDTTTRMVQGVVTDTEGNSVEGAVVQLKNSKTLQIRSFVTKDKGEYYFHGLDPNVDYELKAEYEGITSPVKTLSSFDSRKEAVINLKLEKPKK